MQKPRDAENSKLFSSHVQRKAQDFSNTGNGISLSRSGNTPSHLRRKRPPFMRRIVSATLQFLTGHKYIVKPARCPLNRVRTRRHRNKRGYEGNSANHNGNLVQRCCRLKNRFRFLPVFMGVLRGFYMESQKGRWSLVHVRRVQQLRCMTEPMYLGTR